MKKHLSLIVMALFASAMLFTSCGKEEYTITVNANDPAMGTVTGGGVYEVNTTATLTATPAEGHVFVSWSDGNVENPRQIVVTGDATYTATFEKIQPGIEVSFNGNTWKANAIQAAYYASNSLYDVWAFEDASQQNFPAADVCAGTLAAGTYTDTYDGSTWAEGNVSYIEYYNETSLSDGTYNYGDWWAKNTTINVTEFDATALSISANVDATMFSALEAFVNGAGFDGAPVAPMTVKMVSVDMQASGAKAPVKKYNGKKLVVK